MRTLGAASFGMRRAHGPGCWFLPTQCDQGSEPLSALLLLVTPRRRRLALLAFSKQVGPTSSLMLH